MTDKPDPKKVYIPPTQEEIAAEIARWNEFAELLEAQREERLAKWRHIRRWGLTDDEWDDDQYSQENGDGAIY